MATTDTQSPFDAMWRRLLEQFPNPVDVSDLKYASGHFQVASLQTQLDVVEAMGFGQPDELPWRELVAAVHELVLQAAVPLTTVRVSELRVSAVRNVFERRLRRSISRAHSGWDPAELERAQSFLMGSESTAS